MIVGIGVDVVDIDRLRRTLARVPALAERVFDPTELQDASGTPRRVESLAGRFAAKEAVAKALGAPPGLSFREAVVKTGEHGNPGLELLGAVRQRAQALGVRRLHLSISHDGGVAIAYVVAED